MANKQIIANETATAAPLARVAKPRTPRIKTAQHSKTNSVETEPVPGLLAAPSTGTPEAKSAENPPREAIARIAYGYWETRGPQSGSAADDWFRAEREYRQHTAATG